MIANEIGREALSAQRERERVRRREIEKGRKRNEPQIEYLGNEAEKMEMVVKYR